jgi:aldehyde dehydrogenase (NAD+)
MSSITDTDTDTDTVDIARIVARLRAVHAGGRTRDAAWRIRQLEGIERLVDERESEIAAALEKDLGRTAAEAWLGDVASTKGEAAYARKRVKRWMRRRPRSLSANQLPGFAWIQHEPLGVVLVIAPWNYPVYLALSPLVAAVSAGNAVVVKPSEVAPATSGLLARLIPQYLDPDAIVVVEGDAATTQELLSQGFDHVLFTGGTEVGRKIMAAAAPHLTPVLLELGGKSPVIVAADADLDVVARRVVWGKLLNSGQTCIAPDYVLVERSVRDALVQKMSDTVTQFLADRPGGLRVVNERQFDRLASYLSGTSGRVASGGGLDREALTIEATILVDPAPDDAVMGEEIFGPILPVLAVDSMDEAIEFVRARPKPLAAYYFTRSKALRARFLSEISSGAAVVNHVGMHVLAPQLPFGGVGPSGTGAYHGKWGFEAFSHRKSVLTKPFSPDLKLLYPPYTDKALNLLRRLL